MEQPDLNHWLARMPLIAILRGLRPQEAVEVGEALLTAGFCLIEVPLNSPEPYESIRLLARHLGDRALVGAGTVLSVEQVDAVAEAGGRLIVMPHADTQVVRAACARGLWCTPGVATPTEAFAALAAGAHALKLFPAHVLTPDSLRAWRAVLPADVAVLPVGGIGVPELAPWHAAGARGFGIGSALYQPGLSLRQVAERARAFVQAWHEVAGARA